jgi:hypothetical protein
MALDYTEKVIELFRNPKKVALLVETFCNFS